MLILGIESSCDDTAVAVVENGDKVLSSITISQFAAHKEFGGVVPEIASREHLKNSLEAFYQATAGISMENFDAIAVTQGPGLLGSLLVGTLFAKGLALGIQKPLIPINHVHAHIFSVFLDQNLVPEKIFPSLALVVSGGHTNLYFMKNAQSFDLVAHTLDDACGECFDKVAKMLGLAFPGGPEIEKKAADFQQTTAREVLKFPIPKVNHEHFSFSGLKTSVYYYIKKNPDLKNIVEICHAFQEAALMQVVQKIKYHVGKHSLKSVIVAGGVSANLRFQQLFAEHISLPLFFPQKKYCSDNGAMIAANAYFSPEVAVKNWDVFARYPFEKYLNTEH